MGPVRGTVADFDERAGYGAVRAEDGALFFFHCTRITDGTRTILAGAPVRFRVVPGHRGRWEASDVERE